MLCNYGCVTALILWFLSSQILCILGDFLSVFSFSDGARQQAHDHEVNLFILPLHRWVDFSDDESF